MEDFVARPSKWRIALLILLGLGFVIIGAWMVGAFGPPPVSTRYDPFLMQAFGWIVILFFGFCGFAAVRMFFDKNEQLRINASGICWRRWSDQLIPWPEIADITIWEYQGQKSIVLHLRDAARFPSQRRLGWLAGANRAITGGDIAITLGGTDRRFDEAMSAIAQFRG